MSFFNYFLQIIYSSFMNMVVKLTRILDLGFHFENRECSRAHFNISTINQLFMMLLLVDS